MNDLAHVWYAFGQKSVGGKMANTLPLNRRSSFKCHLINAVSAQSNAMQKITNAHIKIFEVAQSFKGIHHGRKTSYIIAKFK
jgi:hypothetical protein